MENKKKNIILLVIAIAVLSIFVGLASFAYYQSAITNTATLNTSVTLANGTYTFTSIENGSIDLSITPDKMLETDAGKLAQADNGGLKVQIDTPLGSKTTCSYDVVWIWDSSERYETPDKTLGTNEYEISVKAGIGSTSLLEEKDLSKFTWTQNDNNKYQTTLFSRNVTTLTNLNEEYTITANVYNLDVDQENIKNKEYSAHISVDNINCSIVEQYLGYYADANDDGTIDGVIFFDYNIGAGTKSGFLGAGVAVAPKTTGLKSYTTKTVDGKPNVVVPVAGTTGDDRFYVIETANTKPASGDTSAYWYYSLYQHADTSKTSTAFGSGKTNTATMKALWNTGYDGQYAQNNKDLWSIDFGNKFVLSKDEWSVLGSNLKQIATGTYSNMTLPSGATLKFDAYNWSSSLINTYDAWATYFNISLVGDRSLNNTVSVRLALTF